MKKTHINNKGDYVITSGVFNNGILGKSDINAKLFSENTITVDMFGYVFYRKFKYKMVTHARVFNLVPKFDITDRQGNFLVSSLHFLKHLFGYENMCSWAKIKDLKILLPKKEKFIDFDFMDSFIAELEAERIAELSAYLKVSGLDNYKLSDEELKALRDYDSMEWREIPLDDIFEVSTYKKRFDANKVELVDNGGNPYVVRTSTNNGIRGFIKEDITYLNDGNTISFGQDTATAFYQEQPYFTGDKIKILKSKIKGFNKKNAQFFVTSIARSFSKFSWGNSSYSVEIIKNQKLSLPIKNEKIDIKYLEIFTKAISKLIIKDVVQYADKRIEATKDVVSSNKKTKT
ncbi:restriction endonuclease subunit S [Streptococcus marimammalium]|uniref:restriction endonuclease subunit S n=1 Tax=Streptococcus marimammalium TaxID=269666 RepID=UPI001E65DB6C